MSSTTERLEKLLGFDPAKSDATTNSVVTEAIKEIQAERDVEVKGKVKDLLTEAVDLRKKQAEVQKKFDGETKKFEKSLGNLLSRIEKMASDGKEESKDPNQAAVPYEPVDKAFPPVEEI